MKKLIIFIFFLSGGFITSCSKESNSKKEEKQAHFIYKKTSRFTDSALLQTQELFYNDDKQLERIVTNMNQGSLITTIEAIYNDNNIITKIIKSTSSSFSTPPDTREEYNVTITENTVLLSKSNGDDYGILIEFTGEYVDLIKSGELSNMDPLSNKIYKRNSGNNIISYEDHVYKTTFSNYAKGNVLSFFNPDLENDYFILFNLKTSNQLPLTHTKAYSSEEVLYTHTFDASLITYDENNNIIKIGNDSDYVIYEYIEL